MAEDLRQASAKSRLVLTPSQVESGRLALIRWYDGADDFEAGARAIGAAILAGCEIVNPLAEQERVVSDLAE